MDIPIMDMVILIMVMAIPTMVMVTVDIIPITPATVMVAAIILAVAICIIPITGPYITDHAVQSKQTGWLRHLPVILYLQMHAAGKLRRKPHSCRHFILRRRS